MVSCKDFTLQMECLAHAAVNGEEGVGVSAALDLFNSLAGACSVLPSIPVLSDGSFAVGMTMSDTSTEPQMHSPLPAT